MVTRLSSLPTTSCSLPPYCQSKTRFTWDRSRRSAMSYVKASISREEFEGIIAGLLPSASSLPWGAVTGAGSTLPFSCVEGGGGVVGVSVGLMLAGVGLQPDDSP